MFYQVIIRLDPEEQTPAHYTLYTSLWKHIPQKYLCDIFHSLYTRIVPYRNGTNAMITIYNDSIALNLTFKLATVNGEPAVKGKHEDYINSKISPHHISDNVMMLLRRAYILYLKKNILEDAEPCSDDVQEISGMLNSLQFA